MLEDKNNWNKIPTEVYKNILEEAKIRYDEMLSQSETITGRVIKTIIANAAIIAWFSNFMSNNDIYNKSFILIVFTAIVIANYWLSILILFPRKIVLKGSLPDDIFKNEVDLSGDESGDNYSEEDKQRVYYYHLVNRYRKRINEFRPKLNERASKSKTSLILCLILFLYVAMVVLITSL